MSAIREELIFDGDSWFRRLEKAICEARSSIVLETYILEDDSLGRKIVSHLLSAAERGVSVRLLVDGVGSVTWIDKHPRFGLRKGVSCRVYHPLPWHAFSWVSGALQPFQAAIRMFARLNKRNHRKLCVVDQNIAFVGSFNISAVHTSKTRNPWRDTGVILRGRVVGELLKTFETVWSRSFPWSIGERWIQVVATRFRPRTWLLRELSRVLFNGTLLSRRRFSRILRNRFRAARQRVWLTTAYFIPPRRQLRALLKASRCGADVRILIPRQSDVFFMSWVSHCFYDVLIMKGIRIFEYSGSMLHAKTLVVDNWGFVGTPNFNSRSFFHDLEVGVSLSEPNTVEQLADRFLIDISNAHEVDAAFFSNLPFGRRLLARMFLLFRFFL